MLVLVGESASGKSSVERVLVGSYGYHKVTSYTTRLPRENEVDGIDYHFVSEEEFKRLSDDGFFAEQAVYNGWSYGSAINDYMQDDVVAVLTPHGLRQIKKVKDLDVVAIYINVPRRDRLIKILQRGDNIEEAYRRSLSDVGQFDGIKDEVDFVIDNPDYKLSIDEIAKLCHQKMR